MGVLDGQAVSASVTNPAFIDANNDDSAVGKYTLANTEAVSGDTIDNIQREHNSAAYFMGKAVNTSKTDLPAWTQNEVGTASDNLVERGDALTQRFEGLLGHTHDGVDGNGPQIAAGTLVSVPLRGYVRQGVDVSGVTGASSVVTTDFAGQLPGGGVASEGVVTDAPENKVLIRQAAGSEEGDVFEDADGDIVFGRLTESVGVWTLSYFVNKAGVETAYSFAVASDVRYYYQEIFNPLGGSAPVFSEFANIPSDNATADVITATQTLQGKVLLSSAAPPAIASSGALGTVNATVALSDHTHEGLHSISATGEPQLVGDVTLSAAGGTTLTQSGQDIEIESVALTSATPEVIASVSSVGVGTESARSDHTHEGVHAVLLSGEADITGDVTLAVSGGLSAVQAGSTITFSAPSLASTSPEDVGSSASIGVGTTSARADHVHRGLHSIAKNGASQLFGDVTLTGSGAVTLTQTGQDIEIFGSGAIGVQEVPAGVVNGVNGTFGPLTSTPSTPDSLLVFIDFVAVPTSAYSIVGNSIVFGAGWIPATGQTVYTYYLTSGAPIPAPVPSGSFQLEYRTITSGEIAAGQLTLGATPANGAFVVVDLIGGSAQEYPTDFTVAGAILSWSGLGLSSLLVAGSKLRIHYFT